MRVYVGQIPVECVTASSPKEQAIGLSQSPSMLDGEGMLFLYPESGVRTFWMPANMAYAIDIIFINGGKVARIYAHCTPGSKFRYTGTGDHVLEVPAGFCQRNKIQAGAPFTVGDAGDSPELTADTSSDRLRGITTAELYAMHAAKHVHMKDVLAQSTESAPYQRAPSVAPGVKPQERFRDRQIPADYAPDAGPGFVQEVIRDESWNSPTRPASLELAMTSAEVVAAIKAKSGEIAAALREVSVGSPLHRPFCGE